MQEGRKNALSFLNSCSYDSASLRERGARSQTETDEIKAPGGGDPNVAWGGSPRYRQTKKKRAPEGGDLAVSIEIKSGPIEHLVDDVFLMSATVRSLDRPLRGLVNI